MEEFNQFKSIGLNVRRSEHFLISHLPHVQKVAIQTNLSGQLSWIQDVNPASFALWSTFHPEWSNLEQFLAKCHQLIDHKIRFSVGVVGVPRFRAAIATLRQHLPDSVYLWINAVKAELPQLSASDRAFFNSIDPFYELNTHHYPSLGKACRAGESVISVDGEGPIRHCHFIKDAIGNIYDLAFSQALRDRPCTNTTCHCHIGYVHLDYLELNKVFGSGILERIPQSNYSASCLQGISPHPRTFSPSELEEASPFWGSSPVLGEGLG
jgi:hypothetical protein